MPPKIKTTREDIIDAAFELVRGNGIDALNARSLAARLGCSVQPVFRAFDNMEDLKSAVLEKGKVHYSDYLKNAASEEGLLELEMAYIKFAREEQHLFRWLHMPDKHGKAPISGFVDEARNHEVVEQTTKSTGLSYEAATQLCEGCYFATHGVAALIASNSCELSQENIQNVVESVYDGLVTELKSQEA
jgi:AcrR family transcriptional regulator